MTAGIVSTAAHSSAPAVHATAPLAAPLLDLTLNPLPGEDATGLCRRLGEALRRRDAAPLLQFIFGDRDSVRAAEAALREVFGELSWPVTVVEGADCVTGGLAGFQVIAAPRRSVRPVRHRGRVAACVFEDGCARHCLAGGLGVSASGANATQTQQTLEELEAVLKEAGFAFGDLIRTWFYLDDLLSWYGPFNDARTAFYRRHSFRTGSLPASTGIGARNLAGTALTAAAWAVCPFTGSCQVREVASPLQCPAPAYGSSFSRAVEIATLAGRRLLISGTASIAPGGESVGTGDIVHQVRLTMDVVEAILRSRGMNFAHTTRVIAYFKHAADAAAFAAWRARQGVKWPLIETACDVCRGELLFEIELDAVSAD